MREYCKIHSLYKRSTNGKQMLFGEYSLPEFEYLKNNKWIFSEKVDGTNLRIGWNPDTQQVQFGGRTDNASIPALLVSRLNELFNTPEAKEKFQSKFTVSVTLYGEGYGAKIQKGGGLYKPDGQDFVLFDIMIGDNFLLQEDVWNIAELFEIEKVPVVGIGNLSDLENKVNGSFKSAWGNFDAEGIVARPEIELKTRNGSRIITKLKIRDFEKKEAQSGPKNIESVSTTS